ncbi:hypothetical protein Aca07nite_87090 [Actinoplanes capillaceus]|uniref:Uncharacterized protein n=1 Tax=Actinoplanes campanulatus TaxID=113559 RepID=A0ABQ3WZ12_9ACTN|nr:glycosyltransferase family 4 protein [Actinoplanes capillaceus]GID51434.1 hypothetical protein Aca07nite_87090 [Actinoplanes capillaceus]
MKILLAGPDHQQGSLPPYLHVLTTELRRLGTVVDRIGSTGVPYDSGRNAFQTIAQITTAVDRLAARADPRDYDLISLHFGNLEIEQLLGWRWKTQYGDRLPPLAVHVHALDPTLFTTHRPDPALWAAVDTTYHTADTLIYFGDYARTRLTARIPALATRLHRIVPLPTTIAPGTEAAAGPSLTAAMHDPRSPVTVVSLYGYAAPWKSARDLVEALGRTSAPLRVVLAGPFFDDPDQAGIDLRAAVGRPVRLGAAADLIVVPEYLDSPARAALLNGSAAGIFPYRPQPTFQGSGAIADYLARGLPVIATDVANMAELAGEAGTIVAAGDCAGLAAALDRYAGDPRHRAVLTSAAAARAHRFTPADHATDCLAHYRDVVRRTRCRTRS